MLFKVATGLAALLAVFVYRSGRVAWHHILTAPNLPDAYYTGGDWATHCTLVRDPTSSDVQFCEDITFWDHHDAEGALVDRLVLLGCDPNRKSWNTVMGPLRDPAPRAHLFLYDTRGGGLRRLALEGYPEDHDFHPLGMEVYPSRNGSASNLFVVNHARDETTIEQFVLEPVRGNEAAAEAEAKEEGKALRARAHYVRTLRSPYFVSPNAIALTSPTSFYVSNDHLLTRRLPDPIGRVLPLVETVAGLPLSWVAHVSVHESSPADAGAETDYTLTHALVAPFLAFANGVALSPSRAHLAIASTSLGLVHVYAVDPDGPPSSLSLAPAYTISVPFFPDNVAYDDDGVLVVTGHPHFPALIDVAANKSGAIAPSWVVSVAPRSEPITDAGARAYDEHATQSAAKFAPATRTHEVETLFQSDGSVFGSSSTTLRDARTGAIYVAGLYEQGMLVCRP